MQRIFQYIRPPPPSKRKRFFLPSAAAASIPIPIADFSMRHCIRNSYAWEKNRHVRIICRRAVSRAGEVQGHQRGARPDLRRDVRVLIEMGLGRARARKPNPVSIGCDEEEKSETNKKSSLPPSSHNFIAYSDMRTTIQQQQNHHPLLSSACILHRHFCDPPPPHPKRITSLPTKTPIFSRNVQSRYMKKRTRYYVSN